MPKNQPLTTHTKDRARQLRRDATVPERILWGVLRGHRLAGLKFRRQHPIGPYFVDFYCHEHQLVVELDGNSHIDRGEEDLRRQRFLQQQGCRVLRVENDDVLKELESVARAISRAAGILYQ